MCIVGRREAGRKGLTFWRALEFCLGFARNIRDKHVRMGAPATVTHRVLLPLRMMRCHPSLPPQGAAPRCHSGLNPGLPTPTQPSQLTSSTSWSSAASGQHLLPSDTGPGLQSSHRAAGGAHEGTQPTRPASGLRLSPAPLSSLAHYAGTPPAITPLLASLPSVPAAPTSLSAPKGATLTPCS